MGIARSREGRGGKGGGGGGGGEEEEEERRRRREGGVGEWLGLGWRIGIISCCK